MLQPRTTSSLLQYRCCLESARSEFRCSDLSLDMMCINCRPDNGFVAPEVQEVDGHKALGVSMS